MDISEFRDLKDFVNELTPYYRHNLLKDNVENNYIKKDDALERIYDVQKALDEANKVMKSKQPKYQAE